MRRLWNAVTINPATTSPHCFFFLFLSFLFYLSSVCLNNSLAYNLAYFLISISSSINIYIYSYALTLFEFLPTSSHNFLAISYIRTLIKRGVHLQSIQCHLVFNSLYLVNFLFYSFYDNLQVNMIEVRAEYQHFMTSCAFLTLEHARL